MATIKCFEDLIAWQKAREMTKAIYRTTKNAAFHQDLGLQRQMRGAAVSTMSNIAEGFERAGRKEFRQFLVMAKASCAEVRSLLYVAKDNGYIDDRSFAANLKGAEEVGRIIAGLYKSIQLPQKSRSANQVAGG